MDCDFPPPDGFVTFHTVELSDFTGIYSMPVVFRGFEKDLRRLNESWWSRQTSAQKN